MRKPEILRLLIEACEEGKGSIVVDFDAIDRFDPSLAEKLLEEPEEVLKAFSSAIENLELPPHEPMEVRVRNLPKTRQLRIRNLRAKHIGKLVEIEGIVRAASEVRPQIYEAIFQCPECGELIPVEQDSTTLKQPTACSKCERRGVFKLVDKRMYDIRWLTISEPFEITEGEPPSRINVLLRKDLTTPAIQRKTDPGNQIKIVGILKEIPRKVQGKISTRPEIYFEAIYVESKEEEFEEIKITPEDIAKIHALARRSDIYDLLIGSIAPGIYGWHEVKEAILLQLFGGIRHVYPDGTHVRGNIHILITGDPSTAKSQLISTVVRALPRGRYVSGKGVSVDYDDPVIYRENGTIKVDLIGKLVDRFYGAEDEGFVPCDGIEVPAFDLKTGKIAWRRVSYVYRHKVDEPLLKLTLETGREVRVTKDHSIYSIEGTEIKEKLASDLKEGDYVLIPKRIPRGRVITQLDLRKELWRIPDSERERLIVKGNYLALKHSKRKLPAVVPLGEDFLRLLGYYVANGWLDEANGRKVVFRLKEKDEDIVEDLSKIVRSIFGLDVGLEREERSRSVMVTINDELLYLIFKYVLKLGSDAKSKRIPEIVFNCSPKAQLEFIRGFVRGDRGVTTSKGLMSDILYLFLLNGIVASFCSKEVDPENYLSTVNWNIYSLKSPRPEKIKRGELEDPELYGRIPLDLLGELELVKRLKASGYSRVSALAVRRLLSRNRLTLYERLKLLEGSKTIRELSKLIGRSTRATRQYFDRLAKQGYVIKELRDGRLVYRRSKRGEKLVKDIDFLKLLLDSDLGFARVERIEEVEPTGKFVYDFCVDGYENFVAGFGGVCCHNTGAGLTATVVKSELLGGWVLEAGALILSNNSILAIDEFDKISKEDQIAMHEAMSIESYHGDFILTLADGSRRKIRDVVEEFFRRFPSRIKRGVDCEWIDLREGELELLVSDLKEIRRASALRVSRHRAPELFYEVKLSTGRSILVTPSHPFVVFEDGRFRKKTVEDLKPGDLLPIILELEIEGSRLSSEDFSSSLNYAVSEGLYEMNEEIMGEVNFANLDGRSLDSFSITETALRYSSTTLAKDLKKLRPNWLASAGERLPSLVFGMKREDLKELLRVLFEKNGNLAKGKEGVYVTYATSSKELAEEIHELLLRFGIVAEIVERKKADKKSGEKIYEVLIKGKRNLENFLEIGFADERKNELLRKKSLRMKSGACFYEKIPCGDLIARVLKLLKLPKREVMGYATTDRERGELCLDRNGLRKALEKIEERLKEMELALLAIEHARSSAELRRIRKKLSISTREISRLIRCSHRLVSYRELKRDSEEFFAKYKEAFRSYLTRTISEVKGMLKDVEKLAFGKISLCEIREIRVVKNAGEEWSYDISVPGKLFVSAGAVLHNTVSIAKASIVATLPARTAILAAANPKLGRFDPYLPILDQIDIPETLLTRFDLKFALRDVPDRARDEALVDHIVRARVNEEVAKPVLDLNFLRKYIVYARKTCTDIRLTDEAAAMLKNFYVELRNRYAGEEIPTVPITLRQFEALIRLAEASAKVRLDNWVRVEDAERAIRLMKISLQQLGIDVETGRIDIDKIESGISASKRSKMRMVLDIIADLETKLGKNVPIEDVKAAAEEQGIKDIDEILEKLKSEGLIFVPKAGHVRRV